MKKLPNKRIKIKIFGQEKIDWSVDHDRENLALLLQQINSVKLANTPFFADIIYSVWYNQLLKTIPLLKILKKVNKKIIATITNDISVNNEYKKLTDLVDLWISPNVKNSQILKQDGLNYVQLPFFVSDKVFFKINKSKETLAQEIGLPADKIKGRFLIGSFQRDSLGTDLNQPKWQKNPDLFVDIFKTLPPNKFLPILAGPRRHYLIHKLRKNKIPYIFIGDESPINNLTDDISINNLKPQVVNLLYNIIDLYIVTSKNEGGPKAILEASLCRTPIISTDVGLASEYLHRDLIIKFVRASDFANKISFLINSNAKLQEYLEGNYQRVASVINESAYLASLGEIIRSV
jgi:glycosyltransferase involved in cell wall biosynthesis